MTPPVLLVEDDERTREIYRTVLSRDGFRVLEAADGSEGVRLAREHQPCLIIMNVALPVLDGWAATALLKRDPETAAIPILILSGLSTREDHVRSCEAGCDGYLDKPLEPSRLLDAVRKWVLEQD